ncbi:hypothetical protein PV386_48295, partial [Streptomyces europaeiscabiei]|nr:hypothetical protein [Streptomyces europaeiscabiei]
MRAYEGGEPGGGCVDDHLAGLFAFAEVHPFRGGGDPKAVGSAFVRGEKRTSLRHTNGPAALKLRQSGPSTRVGGWDTD